MIATFREPKKYGMARGTPTLNTMSRFEAPSAADYVIWGRIYAPNAIDNRFWFQVDGGAWTLWRISVGETVFNAPHHPYTEALLSAVPTLEGEERPRIRLEAGSAVSSVTRMPSSRRPAVSSPSQGFSHSMKMSIGRSMMPRRVASSGAA